ncbi:hypothetical protein NPIL_261561 [Nephila pilipes]|uniref:HTH psq-type domain-containing protein n=1 Tax=Nephila pilipes TaxID=299642 RepID=A0A8X6T923_NEPPI|nr:hypothetical protein NPIL_261561 [Nephila pilipes]
MNPKVKDRTGEKKKRKKMISMEAKHEIIAKHERGVRIIDLANEYGRNPSAILTSREISDILGKWQEVSDFVEKRHPEKLSKGRASALFYDKCLTFFRNILKRRQKQTSLDRYLVKVSRSESQESEAKKARR